jgi:hypothetical protein
VTNGGDPEHQHHETESGGDLRLARPHARRVKQGLEEGTLKNVARVVPPAGAAEVLDIVNDGSAAIEQPLQDNRGQKQRIEKERTPRRDQPSEADIGDDAEMNRLGFKLGRVPSIFLPGCRELFGHAWPGRCRNTGQMVIFPPFLRSLRRLKDIS